MKQHQLSLIDVSCHMTLADQNSNLRLQKLECNRSLY
uniref:Uncharacterized protein n=1 Tax=Arundo donax TaxID=35708 RepID=A0A0A9C1Y8_ARUDO